MTNPDLERLVFVSIELSMYEFSYLQVADTNLYDKIINLREEKQKLKSKIEQELKHEACEQATLYTKAKKLYNSSKNPLSFLIKSNVDMSAKTKGVSS